MQIPIAIASSMHAPAAGLAISVAVNNGSPSTTANAVLTTVNNSVLVVCVANNSNTVDNCTVAFAGLTFTKRADAGSVNGNNAEIWTAPVTTGASTTITNSWSGGLGGRMITAFCVTGVEAVLGGASGTQNAGATPSIAVVNTGTNSIIFCITADWNGQDGTSRAFRAAAGATITDQYWYHPDGASTYYVYYYTCTTAQSYTIGMTAPGSQVSATAALEIRKA